MRKLRDEQKGVLFILLIILIVVAVGLFFAFSLKTNVVKDTLEHEQVIRMLHVVEDEEGNALFSNVLIYYPTMNTAGIINLPGYTGAIYKTLNRTDKLEAVYNELGLESFKQEVEKLLDIKIQFTSVIKFDDFIKLSDLLGGMRVFIPSPIDVTDADGERYLLPSGAVNLDGDKIAIYLKYREEEETEADIQDRYQNVMKAFLTGLHDKAYMIFSNKNFNRFRGFFNTNLTDEETYTLYNTVAEIDAEAIVQQTITGSIRTVDGEQLLVPLNNGVNVQNAVRQMIAMLTATDSALASRIYVLEIQNGTTVQGLARNTAILFQNASYNVLSAVNADSNDYEETIIIDHIGNEEAAQMIGDFIRCKNIRQAEPEEEVEDSFGKASVDFTIILGRDFNGQYVVRRSSR